MQLFEISIDLKKTALNHPFTYKTIAEMSPNEALGCWVSVKEETGLKRWSGLMRFYRGHIMGARGAYSVHGYLWFMLPPLPELWRAWGFSAKPSYSLKPLKHAPGYGLEWEVIASADTPDELLWEIDRLAGLAKHTALRAMGLLQASARHKQMGVSGEN